MKSKTHMIDKLVSEKKSLYKQGVYRSEEQTKAEDHIMKMTKLLREYDVQNKFLNKKVEQLIGENYQLKTNRNKSKSRLSSTWKVGEGPKYIKKDPYNANQSTQT